MLSKDLLSKYSMVVLFAALLFKHVSSATPPPYTFKCDQSGVIQSITKPNGKIVHILLDDGTICSPADISNFKSCEGKTITSPTTLKLIIEDERHKDIIGGLNPAQYELSCDNGPQSVTATALPFRVTGTKSPFTVIKSKTTPSLTLTVSTDRGGQSHLPNDVHIGDELYLILTTSDDHKVSPSSCKAISGSSQHGEIEMWNSCGSNDASLIEQKWTKEQGKAVSIKMYAFRFTDSPTVTISCTAMVCLTQSSDPDCSQTCTTATPIPTTADPNRRRRREIQNLSRQKVASATFTVSSPYQANSAEGLSGNSVRENLIVLFLVSVVFVLLR